METEGCGREVVRRQFGSTRLHCNIIRESARSTGSHFLRIPAQDLPERVLVDRDRWVTHGIGFRGIV
jgi:hypothetical protein